MATIWKCNKCDFEFNDGYSHHLQCAWAYCRECGLNYDVKSTQGYWGFIADEDVQIRVSEKKGRPMVIKVRRGEKYNVWDELKRKLPLETATAIIKDGKFPEYDHKLIIPIDSIQCIKCRSKSLSMEIREAQNCPKCKTGIIINNGTIIF